MARALFLDQPDPERSWGELRAFQAQLIERLTGVRELRMESAGTDVTLSVKGRTWVNSDGKRNMPSGEVFTGPHEASAEREVRFDVPSSPAGVDVEGVELQFGDGLVVGARAERGEDYLQRALHTDAGARRLGEMGIGTNFGIDRAIGATLFDEKIGGTVHLALGRSYPETGGRTCPRCIGTYLRPALRRPADRRRRGHPAGGRFAPRRRRRVPCEPRRRCVGPRSPTRCIRRRAPPQEIGDLRSARRRPGPTRPLRHDVAEAACATPGAWPASRAARGGPLARRSQRRRLRERLVVCDSPFAALHAPPARHSTGAMLAGTLDCRSRHDSSFARGLEGRARCNRDLPHERRTQRRGVVIEADISACRCAAPRYSPASALLGLLRDEPRTRRIPSRT